MLPSADSSADPPAEAAGTAAVGSSGASVPATAARPSSWAKLAENPLQTLLATAVVALLIFNLTSTNASIADTNDRITRLGDGVTRLGDRVTRLEERMEARFAAQDAKIDEINLKLTALIAALNMTKQVDAAMAGTVIAAGVPPPNPDSTR